MKKTERVSVYIDGFNLYFGMRAANCGDCRWLDVHKLAMSFLKQDQELSKMTYYTARVRNHPNKEKRQKIYLDALQSIGVYIKYGHYQSSLIECHSCYHTWATASEKMTDVNIATDMVVDAYKDKYDVAILVSGDSDLTPPIKAIHSNFNNKRIVVAFPPSRHSVSLKKASRGSFIIGRKKLKDVQLDLTLKSKSGYVLIKPLEWDR